MKTTACLFLLFLAAIATQAQQVVASSGSSSAIPGYTIDWTLGEPVIQTFSGSAYILTQGMHQTKLLVTSLQELAIPGLDVKVYPNPVGDKLTIEIKQIGNEQVGYEITDIFGRIILKGTLQAVSHEIDMSRYVPGLWFLRVVCPDNRVARVCKIIKS